MISSVYLGKGGSVIPAYIASKKDVSIACNKTKGTELMHRWNFKMKKFHMMEELIKPQNWLVKVEVRDAYFLISIQHNSQECLIFNGRFRLTSFAACHSACHENRCGLSKGKQNKNDSLWMTFW